MIRLGCMAITAGLLLSPDVPQGAHLQAPSASQQQIPPNQTVPVLPDFGSPASQGTVALGRARRLMQPSPKASPRRMAITFRTIRGCCLSVTFRGSSCACLRRYPGANRASTSERASPWTRMRCTGRYRNRVQRFIPAIKRRSPRLMSEEPNCCGCEWRRARA